MRRPEGLDRKISVEQGGKKKISVDRAQVIIGRIIMMIKLMIMVMMMMMTRSANLASL